MLVTLTPFSIVTERVIAMSFPSMGVRKMYRNPIRVSMVSNKGYGGQLNSFSIGK